MAKVKDRDNGYKALLERAKKLSEGAPFVEVGILQTEGDADKGAGLTLFDVAEQHEFGFGVPERSFIRAFFDETETEARKVLAKQLTEALDKTGRKEALNKVGIWLVAKCQSRIRAHIEPANSPQTIARKGSSTPLIDTGQLWTSISYRTPDDEVRPSVRGGAKSEPAPKTPKAGEKAGATTPKAKGGNGRDERGRFLPKAPKAKGGNGRDERGRFLPKAKK